MSARWPGPVAVKWHKTLFLPREIDALASPIARRKASSDHHFSQSRKYLKKMLTELESPV
jgi:hypothetical protein